MPVNQMGGIQIDYAELAGQLSFNTAKDYEDWIARLHALPDAFSQVTTNMSLGVDDGRVEHHADPGGQRGGRRSGVGGGQRGHGSCGGAQQGQGAAHGAAAAIRTGTGEVTRACRDAPRRVGGMHGG